ncbi:MAG: hypothetical protein ACOY3X_11180 [Pseudomonadota bacterium]
MPSRQTPRNPPTRFFHEHGYGPGRLAAALARLAWSQPEAMERARRLIDDFSRTALALLQEVARTRRLTPARFTGWLLDHNDPDEHALLWLVLLQAGRLHEPVRPTHTVQAQLDRHAAPLRAHAQLLLNGTLPATRLHELAPVDADTVLALHIRETAAAGQLGKPAVLARILKLAAAGEDRPKALATKLRRLRTALLAAAGTAGHARLDYATFRTLPNALRRALLFTHGLPAAFLSDAAQAAARPPSPDFDALYFDRALADLADGALDHLDVDTLVLGAEASPVFRARIVQALANGSGALECADDVRERLIAAADVPEICLIACAVARHRHDMQRALAQPKKLPKDGVLGEALHRFAQIARNDAGRNPPETSP